MSTAKTRRPGAASGSQRGTGARTADKASDAIPVLIRLPRLALEPEPDEEREAGEGEMELRATVPLLPAAADRPHSPGASDDSRRTDEATAAGVQPGAASQLAPPGPRPSPWSQFHPPRWAVHAGIAVGLIVILAIAYAAIRGSTQSSNELAEGGPAPAAAWPPPGLPAIEIPPPLTAAPAAVAEQPAAVSAAAANGKKPAVEDTSASPAIRGAAAAKDKSAAIEPPLQLPQQPVTPAADTGAGKAAPASAMPSTPSLPASAELNAAVSAESAANVPLTSGSMAGAPQGSAGGDRYPMTNPTTFQYPANYHERLGRQAQGPVPEINGAGADGPTFTRDITSGTRPYDWPPDTARLQPRIEPPPMR